MTSAVPIHRILLVDDELKVLNGLLRSLSQEPYQITTTTSPDEAIHLLAGQEFAVIVTDQRMPDMQGVQLLEHARKVSPHTMRLILTGHADMQSVIDAINRGAVYRFLTKPCREDDLQQALRQAVEHFELTRENRRLQELTQAQLEHLHRLNAELLERRHFEVAIAARIQQTLLQGEIDPLLTGEWDAAALIVPSQQVDGDFFDLFHHGSTCFDVVVGDVMGKGVPAALLGAATKTRLVRAMAALKGTGLPEPEEIITQVHRLMTPQLLDLNSFVTLCYARFDLPRQQLSFVDCGHTPVLHYRCAAGDCAALKGVNLPLGIRASEEYRQITTAFGPGDRFLFYSDGVTEAQNPTGGYYDEERLNGLLCRFASRTPRELIELLRADVDCFTASESLADDLTCVAVAIGPPAHSLVLEGRIEDWCAISACASEGIC
jgi:sigma-B regulation protein RsbU (phosphoserine phosphatase)